MTKSVQTELHAMRALLLHLQNQLDMSVMLFCRAGGSQDAV